MIEKVFRLLTFVHIVFKSPINVYIQTFSGKIFILCGNKKQYIKFSSDGITCCVLEKLSFHCKVIFCYDIASIVTAFIFTFKNTINLEGYHIENEKMYILGFQCKHE